MGPKMLHMYQHVQNREQFPMYHFSNVFHAYYIFAGHMVGVAGQHAVHTTSDVPLGLPGTDV